MCDGRNIYAQVPNWIPFASSAQTGKRGFGDVPDESGVYVLRVAAVGMTDLAQIKEAYAKSEFMRARSKLDIESEAFFKKLGLGEGWGWQNVPFARQRLDRLDRIDLSNGVLDCPVVYIGKANNLRRRMQELACTGHTANDPFWALLLSNWQLEIGVRTVRSGSEAKEEERLKDVYRARHAGKLPALVHR